MLISTRGRYALRVLIDLAENQKDVNAYAASVFYTVDRYASFKSAWGDYYSNGGTVIDRKSVV